MNLIMLKDLQLHQCYSEFFKDQKARNARARELRKEGYEFVKSSKANFFGEDRFIVEYAGKKEN